MPKKTIGRKDKIDLPKLGLFNLDAKIDTGAYGCAIHCHHVEHVNENGVEKIRFKLLDPSHPEYEDRYIYCDSFGTKVIKSTIGNAEERFTFKTELIVFGKKYKVTLSLADREKMRYPILIGRKFLNGKFIVDVSQKDLSFLQKK